MSVRDLHADVEYLEGEINRLSREIHDSLRVTNSPGRGRRPRPGMSTSTLYVRRRDSVSGYVSGDVCMCDDEDPVPSDQPPVQNNANPRTSYTNPGPNLKGENELQTPLESSTESQLDVQFESEVIDERQSRVEVTDELAGEFESKRNRRAPVWMRDYVTE
uniref:Uncharacterized protein n=1 Tax=Magallana gigas TaxID=29159 RepID=A0A8W8P0V8_MAGGI